MKLPGRRAENAAGPALPKAELHCHIEGTASPGLVLELAARQGIDVGDIVRDGRFVWRDFKGFLTAYDRAAALFCTQDDYRRLVFDHLQGLSSQGTIYAEIFISPDHATQAGLSPADYADALAEGIAQAQASTGIVCRMVVVGVRHFGAPAVEAAARFAASARHPLITGFGLAGDERVGVPADFATSFDIARDAGLGLTAHAGEFCGPDAIAATLDHLGPTRLGHGVRAIEDRALVQRIVEAGVTLEVCPGSNLALGVYRDAAAHPLRALASVGCKVTVSSDDPPFFGTSLTAEYDFAEGQGFSRAEQVGLTRNAIDAAFVDAETRGRLRDRLILSALALGAPGMRP